MRAGAGPPRAGPGVMPTPARQSHSTGEGGRGQAGAGPAGPPVPAAPGQDLLARPLLEAVEDRARWGGGGEGLAAGRPSQGGEARPTLRGCG